MNALPSVDVVIATYNRQPRLKRTLASLEAQTVSGFGVTVIDDCSEPPVDRELSRALEAKCSRVSFVRTAKNGGPARARNLAVRASQAELIAFIDDDVDASPSWLEELTACYRGAEPEDVVIGPLLAPGDWRPTPWNRWEAAKLAHEYRRMQRGEYAPTWRQFFTGNALLRREDFMAAGGFNESFRRAEDIELGLRLARRGSTFHFAPRAKGWHYAHRSRASWLSNADQYAMYDVELHRRYPDLQWLALIDWELSRRSPQSRICRAFIPRRASGLAVRAAVGCSIAFNRGPFTGIAVKAASLAYDIAYRTALEKYASGCDRQWHGPSVPRLVPFNPGTSGNER